MSILTDTEISEIVEYETLKTLMRFMIKRYEAFFPKLGPAMRLQ